MKNSMIEITIGSKVMETSTGRIGIAQNFKVTPSGAYNSQLCTIMYVLMEDETKGRSVLSATVDKFEPVDSEEYPEYYPTVEACRISDILAATI
jgi:hypothetical protein